MHFNDIIIHIKWTVCVHDPGYSVCSVHCAVHRCMLPTRSAGQQLTENEENKNETISYKVFLCITS